MATNSPPAFPDDGQPGMSLRDYYAGGAVQGMLANPSFRWDLTTDHTPEENVARRAFAIADAMLAERRPGEPTV